jgi:NTE family protein
MHANGFWHFSGVDRSMSLRTGNLPSLNLALQGGGAHGAFTWGVLDALLEDGSFDLEGISGTSAGAMNALCLGHGLMMGGRDGARETLARFWTSVAASSPFAKTGEPGPKMAQALKLMLQWTDYLSPEQLNPFDLNPLRDILGEQFDFARLRRDCPVRLFIAATHANSGQLRIFHNHELSVDALLASACLPTIHRTIVIDGEPYWDGGYSANPAVFPLAWQCTSPDILLVLLTPLRYAETPASAPDIRQRLLELSFNSTFLREMRMFAHLRDQVSSSWLPKWLPLSRFERRIDRLRFHAITADSFLGELPSESKLAVNLPFFEHLRDNGREHAWQWLAAHRNSIGSQATLDLKTVFY